MIYSRRKFLAQTSYAYRSYSLSLKEARIIRKIEKNALAIAAVIKIEQEKKEAGQTNEGDAIESDKITKLKVAMCYCKFI